MSRVETIWRGLSFESRKALGLKHTKYALTKGYRYAVRVKLACKERNDRELAEAYQDLISTAVRYDMHGRV